jgi:hypothetical protein
VTVSLDEQIAYTVIPDVVVIATHHALFPAVPVPAPSLGWLLFALDCAS